MKMMTRIAAMGLLAAGLVGCAENNDKAALADPTGAPVNAVTPPGTPSSSEAAAKAMQNSNPMNNDAYRKQ